jgi:hypothetical protein
VEHHFNPPRSARLTLGPRIGEDQRTATLKGSTLWLKR